MNLSYRAEERDRQIHERTGDRKFSVKFAYNLLEGDFWSNSRYKWRLDWKWKRPHKILYISWLIQNKRLSTNELLEEPGI
ncbi:hypothetical protein Peur_068447 [Populus x canadensis]|jgi:hypothetical protein